MRSDVVNAGWVGSVGMYGILHESEIRDFKDRPEICTLTPHQVTHYLATELNMFVLRFYRIVSLDPYRKIQHVCRGDRWVEPDLSVKKL